MARETAARNSGKLLLFAGGGRLRRLRPAVLAAAAAVENRVTMKRANKLSAL